MNKKLFTFLLSFILIALPLVSLAGPAALPNHPTIGQPPAGGDLEFRILQIVDYAWKIFAGVAILMFIYAGILFLTAAGNESQIGTAKKAFIWASVGVAVALIGFSIVVIVAGGIGVTLQP